MQRTVAIEVEVLEQRCVPRHDRALARGMGHVCANHFDERTGKSAEVRQRVPMDPADCAYNYR